MTDTDENVKPGTLYQEVGPGDLITVGTIKGEAEVAIIKPDDRPVVSFSFTVSLNEDFGKIETVTMVWSHDQEDPDHSLDFNVPSERSWTTPTITALTRRPTKCVGAGLVIVNDKQLIFKGAAEIDVVQPHPLEQLQELR